MHLNGTTSHQAPNPKPEIRSPKQIQNGKAEMIKTYVEESCISAKISDRGTREIRGKQRSRESFLGTEEDIRACLAYAADRERRLLTAA